MAELNSRNWANLIAYFANVLVTYASLTGIFGETNAALSKKYQTLVTPVGWAFSIWGPIFIWEGIFAVAQMLPQLRASAVAQRVTPWWCSACAFQVLWTLFFAREFIASALLCMLAILGSLLGLILSVDSVDTVGLQEFWLLRAPFSLHTGWIVAASAVNANVQADAARASPGILLSFAIVSLGIVFAVVTFFAVAAPKPDPISCVAAAWAVLGVSAELGSPSNLKDPRRFNPYPWDEVILGGVRGAALVLGLSSLAVAALAACLRISRSCGVRGKEDAVEIVTNAPPDSEEDWVR